MMDFYEGQDTLLHQLNRLTDTETVSLAAAAGRILATTIEAQYPAPLFDNSAMDGYAVCDLSCPSWQVIGVMAAGDHQSCTLQPGQAMRIFTGAAVPLHTDAVIMQEKVTVHDNILTTASPLNQGENIRQRGEELQQGQTILSRGMLLSPQAISLLASQGITEIPCYKPLRVTVFTSGDELVSANDTLTQNRIFDSNKPMLLAMLQKYHFIEVIDGGVLPDSLSIITERLQQAAATSHAMVISGGASVGDRDLIKPALEQLGQITHWKLAIKPGKPFGWGKIEQTQVMLLPGNPVASFVTFTLLGIPALQVMAGRHILQALPECSQARADFNILPNKQKRREFLRGSIHFTPEGPKVTPLTQQGSHMLSSCVAAQVLIDVPAQTDIHAGQWLTIYPL